VDDPGNSRTNVTVTAIPGGPTRAVQFNNAGVFDGDATLTYHASLTQREVRVQSPAAGTFAGLRFRSSGGTDVGGIGFNEASTGVVLDASTNQLTVTAQGVDVTTTADVSLTIGASFIASAAGASLIESTSDSLSLRGATELHFITNGVDWRWPSADGTSGQKLTTNGAGVLSWTNDATGSSVGPANAIQYSDGAGGFQGTAKFEIVANPTTATVVRINSANNLTGTNAGFQVRNAAGVPQITLNYNEALSTRDITAAGAFGINPSGDLRLGGLNSGNPTLIIPQLASAPDGMTFPAQDGATGQVLTTNGAGALSWQTPTGGGYASVQDEGIALTARPTINFIGVGVVATDDAGNNRTNVTISSSLASTGFTYAISTEAELIAAAASFAANVITLQAASYLIVSSFTLSVNNRIVMPAGCRLVAGGGLYGKTITGNSAVALVSMTGAGVVATENIILNQTGAGFTLALSNTAGQAIVHDVTLINSSATAQLSNAGEKLFRFCRFQAGSDGIITNGATAISNLIMRFCAYDAATTMLNVAVGTTVSRLRFESQQCEVSLGSAAINNAGTITYLECQNNTLWSGGNVFNNTGTITGGRISNNTLIAGNEFSCFSGITRHVPGAGPVASAVVLRNNLWRNVAGTSFKLLNESPIQTNTPPA
jgi:hypothetical protein